eukprot:gene52844-33338_t
MWFAPFNDGGFPWEYILDARTGASDGHFSYQGFPNVDVGTRWTQRYINGVKSPSPASPITETASATATVAPWVHLYLEAGSAFTDDVNIFCRYSNNGFGTEMLKAKFGSVAFWNASLTPVEIGALAIGGVGPASKRITAMDAVAVMSYASAGTAGTTFQLRADGWAGCPAPSEPTASPTPVPLCGAYEERRPLKTLCKQNTTAACDDTSCVVGQCECVANYTRAANHSSAPC